MRQNPVADVDVLQPDLDRGDVGRGQRAGADCQRLQGPQSVLAGGPEPSRGGYRGGVLQLSLGAGGGCGVRA